MASRHAQVGLQMLMERRGREEASQFYYEAERADTLIKQRADFETRTYNRYQAGEMKRRAQKRADESEQEIDQRRKKLAALFQEEDNQYNQELQGLIETPKQRRLRLMESLGQLKSMRQQEHDDYVKMKREQAWRDNCDPLRHQISEALEKQVIAERDQQVIQRDIARMEDDVEEEKYVQATRKATQEYYEQIEQEREEKQMKIDRNRATWLAEMKAHRDKAERQKQIEYEESLEFRTTTEAAIRQAREAAELKAKQQAERRKELDTLNSEQLTRKHHIIEEDKAIDTKYAQQAAEELRKEQEDAMVERLVRMRKQSQNQTLLSTQLNRTKATNEEAERYLQAAQEEAQRKEDDIREKDRIARRQLMLDAVQDRIKTIKLHEQQHEHKKVEKEQEREELEADLAMKRQLDQEEYETRRRLIQNQYNMLDSQTALKHKLEAQRRQEEKESVQQLIQSWDEEEKKIQEELAHPEHCFVGGRFRGHR